MRLGCPLSNLAAPMPHRAQEKSCSFPQLNAHAMRSISVLSASHDRRPWLARAPAATVTVKRIRDLGQPYTCGVGNWIRDMTKVLTLGA